MCGQRLGVASVTAQGGRCFTCSHRVLCWVPAGAGAWQGGHTLCLSQDPHITLAVLLGALLPALLAALPSPHDGSQGLVLETKVGFMGFVLSCSFGPRDGLAGVMIPSVSVF